jgi:nucleotide-binding universal stress UspA family protein
LLTSWRDIAVFLNARPEGERIGRHAAALAQRHDAHLIGIYGVARTPLDPASSYARGGAISSVIQKQREEDEQRAVAAARHFADLTEEYGIRSEFRIIWHDGTNDDAMLRALHCDLIVATHPLLDFLPSSWSAERLLLATGIPVLLIPGDWHGSVVGDTVILAWNRSREARRAAADAMPFIAGAKKVTILTVDSDRKPDYYGEEPGENLLAHLDRHGAIVEIAKLASQGKSVADTILDYAASQQASLLVLGAYSRSRTAERLFGGVTRSLIADAELPLLVSH